MGVPRRSAIISTRAALVSMMPMSWGAISPRPVTPSSSANPSLPTPTIASFMWGSIETRGQVGGLASMAGMLVYVLPGTLEGREADLDVLWDAGATGIEERGGLLRAYFETSTPLPLDGEWTEEPDTDWQEQWKKDLRPVTAGRFTIAPSWLSAEVPPGQLPLLIDPGMAFGTGHHATTRLAVTAISAQDLRGLRVLDVGSGSGILALAAALGGASEVLGVDIDPLTLPAAIENAELNGLKALPGSPARFQTPAGQLSFEVGSLDPE